MWGVCPALLNYFIQEDDKLILWLTLRHLNRQEYHEAIIILACVNVQDMKSKKKKKKKGGEEIIKSVKKKVSIFIREPFKQVDSKRYSQ